MNFPSDYRGQLAGQKWKEDSSYQFSAFGDFTFLTISNLNYEVIYLILNMCAGLKYSEKNLLK